MLVVKQQLAEKPVKLAVKLLERRKKRHTNEESTVDVKRPLPLPLWPQSNKQSVFLIFKLGSSKTLRIARFFLAGVVLV